MPQIPDGIVSALRQFGDGVLRSVESRVELATIELQEQKFRVIRILVWSFALIAVAMMALTFVSFTLVVLFWETARLWVLAGLCLFYLGGVAFLALRLKKLVANEPRPFDATLDEIGRDRECLQPQS